MTLAVLPFQNLSNDAEQDFFSDGFTEEMIAELGAHVSDPHTGRFPRSVASATAVTRITSGGDGGAVADACATALVAAGEQSPALLERIATEGVDVFLIEGDGSVRDPQHLLATA